MCMARERPHTTIDDSGLCPFHCARVFERSQDRACFCGAATALVGEPLKSITSPLELGHFLVQCLDAIQRHRMSAVTVLAAVQCEKLLDFLESEPGRLRLLDKPQTAQIIGIVSANARFARGCAE